MKSKIIIALIFAAFIVTLLIAIAEKSVFNIEMILFFMGVTILTLIPAVVKWLQSLPLWLSVALGVAVSLFGSVGIYLLNGGAIATDEQSLKGYLDTTLLTIAFMLVMLTFALAARHVIGKKDRNVGLR